MLIFKGPLLHSGSCIRRLLLHSGYSSGPRTFSATMKFIDIGANLTDEMFRGRYNGSQKHPADYAHVMQRSWQAGLEKIIITVGTMKEADTALALAQEDDRLYITAGCHPTRCNDFVADPDAYYQQISTFIGAHRDKVVAIGECGLDYDRLKFCDAATQRTYFERQLDLVAEHRLPLFLHCRNAFADFWEILQRNAEKIRGCGGVVHSFDGSAAEAAQLIEFGFYIGLNGCSLKTAEQLQTVAQLPAERLMLETDCPWCGIRPSHAGAKLVQTRFETVKKKEKWTADALIDGRSEPSQIRQVLEVVASVQQRDAAELAEQVYANTMAVFFAQSSKADPSA